MLENGPGVWEVILAILIGLQSIGIILLSVYLLRLDGWIRQEVKQLAIEETVSQRKQGDGEYED